MENLALGLLVQLFLAFGVAGLLWPEKLMPVYGILMFPWRASDRIIAGQSVRVDAVTGATITSQAIMDAALQALRQAGAK